MELLQEYRFVPLDIYKKNMDNKPITNELEAWLAFLSFDEPERILELISQYPKFKAMYRDIYEICLNMERVMSVYSKELQELDQNTVLYMIDEMQAELERLKDQKDQVTRELENQREQAKQEARELRDQKEQAKQELGEAKQELARRDQVIQELRDRLAKLEDRGASDENR